MSGINDEIAAVESALEAYLPYKTALSPAPAYALTRAVEKHIHALLAAASESAAKDAEIERLRKRIEELEGKQ